MRKGLVVMRREPTAMSFCPNGSGSTPALFGNTQRKMLISQD
jgi:hypothetical protein